MDDGPAFSLGPRGWDYKTVARMLFDPEVLLPPCAVIYDSDIAAAEAAGANSVNIKFAGIARDRRRKGAPHAGYHARTITIPLAVARQMAHADYGSYLAWRDVMLSLSDEDAARHDQS